MIKQKLWIWQVVRACTSLEGALNWCRSDTNPVSCNWGLRLNICSVPLNTPTFNRVNTTISGDWRWKLIKCENCPCDYHYNYTWIILTDHFCVFSKNGIFINFAYIICHWSEDLDCMVHTRNWNQWRSYWFDHHKFTRWYFCLAGTLYCFFLLVGKNKHGYLNGLSFFLIDQWITNLVTSRRAPHDNSPYPVFKTF